MSGRADFRFPCVTDCPVHRLQISTGPPSKLPYRLPTDSLQDYVAYPFQVYLRCLKDFSVPLEEVPVIGALEIRPLRSPLWGHINVYYYAFQDP